MKRNQSVIFILLFLFSISFIPKTEGGISVGISPAYLNLGEVEPGQSKIARFYLVTSTKEKMIVHLGSSKGDMNIYGREEFEGLIRYHSEEDVSSWVEFLNNPSELLPPDKVPGELNVGQLREVTFILKIPESAEPGYHTGIIHMDPKIVRSEEADVYVKSIVPLAYIFKVKGDAIRSGNVIDIVQKEYSKEAIWVQIFYENTGTVTTYVNQGTLWFYDKDGKLVLEETTDARLVKPGEIKEFNSFIKVGEIEDGEYDVEVTIGHRTETLTKKLKLDIVRQKPTQIQSGKVTGEQWKISWKTILIILVIILIAYIILRR